MAEYEDEVVDEEYWTVKSSVYACVCITPDFHGTAIVWNTLEEAWKDAKERAELFVQDEPYFSYEKVYDGYEIRKIHSNEIVRCYKVFQTQELV